MSTLLLSPSRISRSEQPLRKKPHKVTWFYDRQDESLSSPPVAFQETLLIRRSTRRSERISCGYSLGPDYSIQDVADAEFGIWPSYASYEMDMLAASFDTSSDTSNFLHAQDWDWQKYVSEASAKQLPLEDWEVRAARNAILSLFE